MAAGGFKEFVAGEVLDEDEINDFLMQGVLVFPGTAARGSAITSPVEGQFSFLADSDSVEFYDGSGWVALAVAAFTVNYLVSAGGAGGGFSLGGGGGAGNAQTGSFTMAGSATFPVIVGAGGAGKTGAGGNGAIGAPSQFFLVRPVGGGGGGSDAVVGAPGASSGGTGRNGTGALTPFTEQGNAGAPHPGGTNNGGGGGGKGGAASTDTGGIGISSSISGSSLFYAGGGGGCVFGAVSSPNNGGSGVGGSGGFADVAGSNATATRGGGGGGGGNGASGGNGGSGVVVFSVPTGTSVSFTGGVTQTNATVGATQVYTVTATSTTSETVTIG
jgi:hypothetical protein